MVRARRALGLVPGNVFSPYVVGSLLIAAVVALATLIGASAGVPSLYVWTVGLTLLSVTLSFVGVFVVAARREVYQIRDLLTGEIWARWRYDQADAERLAAADWNKTKSQVRQSAVSAVLLGAIVGGIFTISGLDTGLSVGISAGLAVLLLAIAAAIYLRGRARFRRDRMREIVFGRAAIMREGVLIPLRGRKVRFEMIEVAEGQGPRPAALRVVRRVERTTRSINDWDIFPRRYWATSETTIPIPTDRQAEADALVNRYRHLHGLPVSWQSPAALPGERRNGLTSSLP